MNSVKGFKVVGGPTGWLPLLKSGKILSISSRLLNLWCRREETRFKGRSKPGSPSVGVHLHWVQVSDAPGIPLRELLWGVARHIPILRPQQLVYELSLIISGGFRCVPVHLKLFYWWLSVSIVCKIHLLFSGFGYKSDDICNHLWQEQFIVIQTKLVRFLSIIESVWV